VACSLFDKSINRVLFDNCGIDDEEFAAILQGLAKLNDFKSIIYKQNTFNEMSMENIIPLFHKKLPNHLEELRIIDCKIPYKVSEELVNEIVFKSQLTKLALVKANLNSTTFSHLVTFFKQSLHLCEIDLTWCEVQQSSWLPFFEVLKDNKKLTYLNLACNRLFDNTNQEQTQTQMEQLVIFIKRNPSLVHVNLQNCDLDEGKLRMIGGCLRKSHAMRAIHLCGNPGINEGLIKWMKGRIHAKPDEKENKIEQGYKSELGKFEIKNRKDNTFQEAVQLRNIMQNKTIGS